MRDTLPTVTKRGWRAGKGEAKERDDLNFTHFGAVRGLRPSTMQTCPPDWQRLHVFSFFLNSHFICKSKLASCNSTATAERVRIVHSPSASCSVCRRQDWRHITIQAQQAWVCEVTKGAGGFMTGTRAGELHHRDGARRRSITRYR